MSDELDWHGIAAGLAYEAQGTDERRYVIAAAGHAWTVDLLIDGEYATEQAIDPHPAATLDDARRIAQQWETDLW